MEITATPAPPVSLPSVDDVRAQFTNLYGTLSTMDGVIDAGYDSNHRPNAGIVNVWSNAASSLDDARTSFNLLHPEQTELHASLGSDVRSLSFNAGSLDVMANVKANFRSQYWSTQLAQPIADVKRALEVLNAPVPPAS